jgi:hypothetical protein
MAVTLLALMACLALFACLRIAPGKADIPMQWSLRGKVNWSAPRGLAFAFIPALALAIYGVLAAGGNTETFTPTGFALLAAQVLHVALVWRWFRKL